MVSHYYPSFFCKEITVFLQFSFFSLISHTSFSLWWVDKMIISQVQWGYYPKLWIVDFRLFVNSISSTEIKPESSSRVKCLPKASTKYFSSINTTFTHLSVISSEGLPRYRQAIELYKESTHEGSFLVSNRSKCYIFDIARRNRFFWIRSPF